MKKVFLSLFTFLAIGLSAYAEDSEFKPSGSLYGTLFADFNSGLNEQNKAGFDMTRAILGYKYKFLPNLEAAISVDGVAGKTKSGEVKPRLYNAYVKYKSNGFTFNAGMFSQTQFSLQQKIWGHRYVMKSAMDLYKMGNSVDLGVNASYDFSPMFSMDATVVNGEGYKEIKMDDSFRTSLGATLTLAEKFYVRVYGDFYNKGDKEPASADISLKNQFSVSSFLGYKGKTTLFGVEWSKQFNNDNIKDHNYSILSTYLTQSLTNKKWSFYGRYDYVYGQEKNNFNWYDDQQMIAFGVEYAPVKYIKISPNFRNINYSKKKSEQFIFVSAEFTF